MTYRLSRRAAVDLDQIYEHGRERFGREQAEAYGAGLLRVFDFLSAYPLVARLRREIDPPVRAHPYKAHLIVYDLEDMDVVILRIVHGRSDWTDNAQR